LQTYRDSITLEDARLEVAMEKVGPTKVTVKGDALYDAKTGKLIKDGLATPAAIADYAAHHYIALPVVDNSGRPWSTDGEAVYCLHGAKYETLTKDLPHARPCPECGGMAILVEEGTVERDCVRCTQCSHEFDARLEMMES
jgi:hypothetical protein